MEATRRLEIELPEKIAEAVRVRVASGQFASESEAVAAGLELLGIRDQDGELEQWLRTEVAERCRRVETGETRLLTPNQVREELEQQRTPAG